ncbi:MAG: hypothetical protein ACYDCL_21685 [Myxococcales bacterium]
MANKSSIPGSPSVPGAAVQSSIPTSGLSAPAAGGATSGASTGGIGPSAVIAPPTGLRKSVQQLVFGVSKDIPAGSSVLVAGTQLTQAQILGLLQPVLDAFSAVDDAEKVVKQSRLSLSALLPQVRQFMPNLKDAMIALFGRGNPILKDFGIKDGASRKKTTVEAKAAAKVKGSETRTLRNTQGKVEKLKTKFVGQVSPAAAVKPGNTGGGTGGAPSGSSGSGSAA